MLRRIASAHLYIVTEATIQISIAIKCVNLDRRSASSTYNTGTGKILHTEFTPSADEASSVASPKMSPTAEDIQRGPLTHDVYSESIT